MIDETQHTRLPAAEANALRIAVLQSMAVALSLTLHNAVAEQQHSQILRNAITSAAAKAILQGKRAEAEELLNLASSKLVAPNLTAMMAEVKAYLETVEKQLQEHALELA